MKPRTLAERLVDRLLDAEPAVMPDIDEPIVEPGIEPDAPPAGPAAPDPDDPWRRREIHPGTAPRPKAEAPDDWDERKDFPWRRR